MYSTPWVTIYIVFKIQYDPPLSLHHPNLVSSPNVSLFTTIEKASPGQVIWRNMAALWVRIQASLKKIQNGRLKQRSGRHTQACQKKKKKKEEKIELTAHYMLLPGPMCYHVRP
jgi:hypothetical protein